VDGLSLGVRVGVAVSGHITQVIVIKATPGVSCSGYCTHHSSSWLSGGVTLHSVSLLLSGQTATPSSPSMTQLLLSLFAQYMRSRSSSFQSQ